MTTEGQGAGHARVSGEETTVNINFLPTSHLYGSSSMSSAGDGSSQEVQVDGECFGFIEWSGGRDYTVSIGPGPYGRQVGVYQSHRKAQMEMLAEAWRVKSRAEQEAADRALGSLGRARTLLTQDTSAGD